MSITLQRLAVSIGSDVFGAESITNYAERTKRFAEEAIELMQARGLTQREIMVLMGHVYGRPAGEVKQEIAGVAVTLYALANTEGVYVTDVVETELWRIANNKDAIRAKAAKKPDFLFAVRPIAPEVAA